MNSDRLLRYADLCRLSYEDDDLIRLEVADDLLFIEDGKSDVQMILLFDAPDLVIAFRGTDSVKDWSNNVDFDWDTILDKLSFPDVLTDECNEFKVHRGFLKAYLSVRVALHEALNSLGVVDSIFITGHSLGGALATLCTFDLMLSGFAVRECVTFGSPKVGNASFRGLYDSSTSEVESVRVVHEADPVQWLPTKFLGFRHVGHKVRIETDWLEMLKSYLFGFRIRYFLRKHDIDSYYGAMQSKKLKEELNGESRKN